MHRDGQESGNAGREITVLCAVEHGPEHIVAHYLVVRVRLHGDTTASSPTAQPGAVVGQRTTAELRGPRGKGGVILLPKTVLFAEGGWGQRLTWSTILGVRHDPLISADRDSSSWAQWSEHPLTKQVCDKKKTKKKTGLSDALGALRRRRGAGGNRAEGACPPDPPH